MNTEELIEDALSGAGKLVGGPAMYVLEGHSERNEFRILTADEVLRNNLAAFGNGFGTGYVFLGMFTTKEAAEESIDVIRRLIRDEYGNRMG